MTQKIKWGILSTAKIAQEKVIPAMQRSQLGEVVAIASRDAGKAKDTAAQLNIPQWYDSYEALLNDKEIDAIYIPLPNHMHVPWAVKCIEAGKHVLCEKPIGLTTVQAQQLIDEAAKQPRLKVMEAFMYRFHPQWEYAMKMVKEGTLGELKTVQSFFSYNNTDPNNIRNIKEVGGGGLMDIGCYCISFARTLFSKEPKKVFGSLTIDPQQLTDTYASAIMDFENGTSTFTCSTKLFPYQRVNIIGMNGRLEIMIPVNAPPEQEMEMWHYSSAGAGKIQFKPADQYTLQCDAFSKCILEDKPVPYPLEDALNNMKVIEAIFRSGKEGTWVEI